MTRKETKFWTDERGITWHKNFDFGEVMPLAEFADLVESGCIIDDAGYGCLATAENTSDLDTFPSSFCLEAVPDGFTHVAWFNK